MTESWTEFFSSALFMPHGHCYLWKPAMIWLQVASNGLIGLAYVAISSTLAYLVYRLKDDIPFQMMYLAFGAFIVLCGVTHFLDVYVIWKPVYWIDGTVRAVTAMVSAATALLLPPLIPHAVVVARGAKAVRDRGFELETAVKDLETMYRQAKELEQLKSQFFANVSHELRTPLALILGPVEKLLSSDTLRPDQRRDLEVAQRNARTLHKHVNDLLDAARLEAGKMSADYVFTDLARLARLIAGNFDGLAQERGITYVVDVPTTLPAQIDPDKLQRVVLNLLSNAFKFTPAGGSVHCKVNSDSQSAVITVDDSGPGIPAEHREVVFERFRQLDGGPKRKTSGTGLGLAIVRDFVALHGGKVAVDDSPLGGARLTVELPLSAPPGVEVRTEPSETGQEKAALARQALEGLRTRVEAVPSIRAKGKPHVLVVEDNVDMNHFVCETLSENYVTESAFDGLSGLAKVKELRPDLVVTDVMMPGLSGDELVREIRALPDLQNVPIVLLTAKADDELRVKLLREGAQDFLTKPFSAEELRARVGNLITLKRAQDVLQEAKNAAETANRELESFSYSVSHDLRAPLRGLDGFSQALLEDYADKFDEQGKDYLQRIRAAAQRMAQLIDDLIRLSRVSRTEMRRDTVDLSSVTRAIVAELKAAEPERNVDIVLADGLTAIGDARLLRVALENLIGNAWKFTNRRPDARIELGRVRHSDGFAFFVRDNGAGFDMTYADRLFNAFQRLHTDQEFEGTGIGLATVRRIIRRHEGRIWAEAAVNSGATFYFTLPQSRGRYEL